jgi:membrane protease subunit HflC
MHSNPRTGTTGGVILRCLFAVFLVGLLATHSAYFAVREGEAAVVTRFGQPIREVTQPGPHFKWPWPIEQARPIDLRWRVFNTPYTATLTRDRKNVILLTYVAWHVEKPLLFLQAVGDADAAERKLDGMVTAAKNIRVGDHDLSALLSTDAADLRGDDIEQAILADVRTQAAEKFGIAVQQVGIKRIAYPEQNVSAVLAQMRAERKTEADRLRAEGEKQARAIRDDAQVKGEELLKTGREEAGRIRGQAEKQAAEIYAQVQQADPGFYRFWRSLQAMKKTLGSESTVILRTDQGFFDVLTQPPGEGNRGQGIGNSH